MKIKHDFITNSSSASFILNIHTNFNTLKEFESSWEDYIRHFISDNYWNIDAAVKKYRENLKNMKRKAKGLKLQIDKGTASEGDKLSYGLFYKNISNQRQTKKQIERMLMGDMTTSKIVGKTYQVTHFTSMYNFVLDDVPRWMQYLLIMKELNPALLTRFGFLDVSFEIEEDN